MRIIFAVFFLIMTFIMTGAVHVTEVNRNSREIELQEGLNNSLSDSLNVLFVNKSYEIEDIEELMADFCAAFLVTQNSPDNITVSLVGANFEEGLVFVEVSADYRFLNGDIEKITCKKAVLLEEE